MRAVNLVPAELRGGSAGPTRSGAGVYVVLGVLAVALLLVTATTLLGKRVADREADAATLEAKAAEVEQRAAQFTRYKALAAETGGRVRRVREIAAGRVDWSDPLAQVSRTVGAEVRFSSVTATSAPGAGGAAAGNPLRTALAVPAVEVAGCARDHAAVARMIARLRAMDRVQRVSLSESDGGDDRLPNGAGGAAPPAAATPAAGSDKADCSGFTEGASDFALVIFLEPVPGAPAAAVPGAAAPAAATTGAQKETSG